jgi:hypothetical protein
MQFLQSSLAPDGRFDYRCSLCGRSSWHRGNMKKHMIRMHAKVRRGGPYFKGGAWGCQTG